MNTLKITGLFAIALMLLSSTCKEKLDIAINKTSASEEFTIEKGTPVGAISKVMAVDVDLQQIASDNGVDLDKFKSLKIKGLVVESTNGVNFDALNSATISIESDGNAKKAVVSKNPVNSNGATNIDFDVDPDMDLLPYFKGNNIKLHLDGETNTSLTEDLNGKATITYEIIANPAE